MSMPQWLAPKPPQFKGQIRRHRSVMYEPSREQEYIQHKQQWLDTHPEATADECLAAFRKIAQRCGI